MNILIDNTIAGISCAMIDIRTRKTRRGVIGIESAIVLIAFVIVAAALAFVVLNMGFSTTQKSKAAIISSVAEASSALEISGKVTGIGQVANGGFLNMTAIPIKIAGGGVSVNMDPAYVAIKYYSNSVSYDNIYSTSCITTTTYGNLTDATASMIPGCISSNPINGSSPSTTHAFVYWAVARQSPANSILDVGENAVIAIAYKLGDRPQALDNIKVEVIVPTGSALTVERTVPSITNQIVDLG